MPSLPKEPKRPWVPEKQTRNDVNDRFYDSKAWKALRKHVLNKEPLCRECKKENKITPARMVDHIIQRKKRPDLSLVESNLQPMCSKCHAKKSAREARG